MVGSSLEASEESEVAEGDCAGESSGETTVEGVDEEAVESVVWVRRRAAARCWRAVVEEAMVYTNSKER